MFQAILRGAREEEFGRLEKSVDGVFFCWRVLPCRGHKGTAQIDIAQIPPMAGANDDARVPNAA